MAVKTPRIKIMGDNGMEEVAWDSVPAANPSSLDDYFAPVKLSPKAIDQASRIVPMEAWTVKGAKVGLHTWLTAAANHVFKKVTPDKPQIMLGRLRYSFGYDEDGPVLESVSL